MVSQFTLAYKHSLIYCYRPKCRVSRSRVYIGFARTKVIYTSRLVSMYTDAWSSRDARIHVGEAGGERGAYDDHTIVWLRTKQQ